MTESVKTRHNQGFFQIPNNYTLLSQMYALAKFQPYMPITFQVMALQSSNSKMIDLYSKNWENKLHTLTKNARNL